MYCKETHRAKWRWEFCRAGCLLVSPRNSTGSYWHTLGTTEKSTEFKVQHVPIQGSQLAFHEWINWIKHWNLILKNVFERLTWARNRFSANRWGSLLNFLLSSITAMVHTWMKIIILDHLICLYLENQSWHQLSSTTSCASALGVVKAFLCFFFIILKFFPVPLIQPEHWIQRHLPELWGWQCWCWSLHFQAL